MASNIEVWYVLAGCRREPLLWSVEIPLEAHVDDLARKIAEECKAENLRADLLDVYKCVPPLRPDEDSDLAEQVNTAFSKEVKELHPMMKVKDLGLESGEALLVRPVNAIPTQAGSDASLDLASVFNSNLVKTYEHIFIKVETLEAFRHSDIALNHIGGATAPIPEFVTAFEEMLDRKPILPNNHLPVYETTAVDPQSWTACFESPSGSEGVPHDRGPQLGRVAEAGEVAHYSGLMFIEWQKYWSGVIGAALNGHLVDAMFFLPFHVKGREGPKITTHLSTSPWPFQLILRCDDAPLSRKLRTYQPRSDFRITEGDLPRLLIEVDSYKRAGNWPPDKIRMLLAGASVVYYRATELSLSNATDRVKFTRQLYNLRAGLKSSTESESMKDAFAKLRNAVDDHGDKYTLESLYTRSTGGSNRTRTSDDGNSSDGDSDVPRTCTARDTAEYADFKDHGYDVEPDVMVDEKGGTYERLIPLPSQIRIVYRRKDRSKALVAKKIRPKSKELEILKLIRDSPSPSKHVILLLDSFSGRTGSWGILPRIPNSLAHYLALAPSQLSGNVVQVCWGLIKGLAYLHALCIAHRDIKPDNLLIDRGFCLKIIDLDLALQVRDEDEEVTNYNGTEGWMAPEVEKELPHSPIKADRWSCGHLLLHLLDRLKVDDEILRAAAEKLNVDAPQLRPSLVEWRSWVASPPDAVRGGFPVVPLVRPRPT
ncbi:hypothetical protein OE88DRAFT_1737120 [Heliocybe sulcata]|uniref:Protein kinase domain-containing protein n=1 Tax=Heliocybe sulcata TaxID=5364 RepID=A0A5C3MVE1_9AGAM|nr:hypothetical protein OE88DRAFT_1737120 [Heliocybe sulcata]